MKDSAWNGIRHRRDTRRRPPTSPYVILQGHSSAEISSLIAVPIVERGHNFNYLCPFFRWKAPSIIDERARAASAPANRSRYSRDNKEPRRDVPAPRKISPSPTWQPSADRLRDLLITSAVPVSINSALAPRQRHANYFRVRIDNSLPRVSPTLAAYDNCSAIVLRANAQIRLDRPVG